MEKEEYPHPYKLVSQLSHFKLIYFVISKKYNYLIIDLCFVLPYRKNLGRSFLLICITVMLAQSWWKWLLKRWKNFVVIVSNLVVDTMNWIFNVSNKCHTFIFSAYIDNRWGQLLHHLCKQNLCKSWYRLHKIFDSKIFYHIRRTSSYQKSNVNSLPIKEKMFLNRMDIKEFLEAKWSFEL